MATRLKPRRPEIQPDGGRSFVILGIDPGLERTGYAVVEMPRRVVRDAGLVTSNARHDLGTRLAEIADGLVEVLDEQRPDRVAVEALFAHYKHPRTAILMGHARGLVLAEAARRGIEVVSLAATEIKRTLTGNGHASKAQMQRAIQVTLGLYERPAPADVADALAIAFCAGVQRPGVPRALSRNGRRRSRKSSRCGDVSINGSRSGGHVARSAAR